MYIDVLLAIVVIGAIYGFLKPGKEDRETLLKKGFLIGVVLAGIFTGIGMLMGRFMMLFESSLVGAIIFFEIVVFTILFIIGTFIGDFFEDKIKTTK